MNDDETPTRNELGHFVPGTSGNPAGVSKRKKAVKDWQKENEESLPQLMRGMIAPAAKLHAALLKSADLTNKEAIDLLKLTYEYSYGKPHQAQAVSPNEANIAPVEEYTAEILDGIENMIAETRKGIKPV